VGGGGLQRRFKLTSGVIKVKSYMLWSSNVRFKHAESQTTRSSHSLTKRVYLSPPSAFLIFAENGEGVCFFNQRTHRFAQVFKYRQINFQLENYQDKFEFI
jgi:hypothetical protein